MYLGIEWPSPSFARVLFFAANVVLDASSTKLSVFDRELIDVIRAFLVAPCVASGRFVANNGEFSPSADTLVAEILSKDLSSGWHSFSFR